MKHGPGSMVRCANRSKAGVSVLKGSTPRPWVHGARTHRFSGGSLHAPTPVRVQEVPCFPMFPGVGRSECELSTAKNHEKLAKNASFGPLQGGSHAPYSLLQPVTSCP